MGWLTWKSRKEAVNRSHGQTIVSHEEAMLARYRSIRCRLLMRAAAAGASSDGDEDTNEQEEPDASADSNKPCLLVWSDHLCTILCGTRDPDSPLSLLRGFEDSLVRAIYVHIISSWKACISRTLHAHEVGRMDAHDALILTTHCRQQHGTDTKRTLLQKMLLCEESYEDPDVYTHHDLDRERQKRAASILHVRPKESSTLILGLSLKDRPRVAFTICGKVTFPKPRDINVIMMPFIMGDPLSLPSCLQPYYECCISKCAVMPYELGKVCYLTVEEGITVKANNSQRQGRIRVLQSHADGLQFTTESHFVAGIECAFDGGRREYAQTPDELHGGLFMASNMAETCTVWNSIVKNEALLDGRGGIDHHLRPYLGEATKLSANQLVWMTDQTPHETTSLSQVDDGGEYRQFFRLVTSEMISVWDEKCSSSNPKVPLPSNVRVIK